MDKSVAAAFDTDTPNSLLTNNADIYGALRTLVMMDEPVTVLLEGISSPYTTRISDVDFKSRSFFMSELIPADGNEMLRQGKRFRIKCEKRGVTISFLADGRLRYQTSSQRYRGEFPSKIEYIQRRGSYRVNVPSAHQLTVEIPESESNDPDLIVPKYRGRLLDLSESGFKAMFTGDMHQELKDLNPVAAATIRFNEQQHMDCGLELKHLITDQQGNTRAGYVFTRISSNAQRYIRKLITDFQWEERNQQEQEDEGSP